MTAQAVTPLSPTTVFSEQFDADDSKVSIGQREVAPGLTASPTGRSTRTYLSSLVGLPSNPCRTMNWVKPNFGWPAASSKKYSLALFPGAAPALQKSAALASVIGGSFRQVPACQPELTVGSCGLLDSITAEVSAAAKAGIRSRMNPIARATSTPTTEKVIHASPHDECLLQKHIPSMTLPESWYPSQYFLVMSLTWSGLTQSTDSRMMGSEMESAK